MHILIVLNDPPYGTERSYNGLRLAKALGREEARVTLFLLADAVVCANRGQKVPQGFYNVELMLNSVIRKGEVLLCGNCMDARGVGDDDLVADARRSSMKELGEKTLTADKVLVF
ncbi:MAG: DsrE family protein [Candidatus Thiodiazotropha endolucinida]|nr:DsrE family protein [Candidatus Thiodiazotropha endolucinida]